MVTRNSPQDIKVRDLLVFLDEKEIANLQYKEEIELQVPLGRHTLKATNTLSTKVEDFEASTGEIIRFAVRNRFKGFLALIMMMLGFAPYYVELERVRHQPPQ